MNKLTSIFLSSTITAGLLIASSAQAVEKRYVSDELRLQLRSGPSNENRIMKSLRSGEHLIMVEEDAESGYTKVNTSKGLEGWVLTRFLKNEPVAKERLIIANRKLEQQAAELKTLKSQNKGLLKEKKNLGGDRSTLSREKSSLEKELKRITEISANAIALDEKVTKLTMRNQELEIQMETSTNENRSLKEGKERKFLIIGGVLVIIGIIAGLIIPTLRNTKSRNDGW